MYSCSFQTGQYIIPYHIALLASNGQKDRFGGDISGGITAESLFIIVSQVNSP